MDRDAVEQVLETLKNSLRDRYDVRSVLGRGGMAIVFEAHDIKHDRSVALKVLKRELSVAVARDRFLQEIRFAAQLSHPHILALLDSGDADGLLYFVMPIVHGGSLADRLRAAGPLPVREALELARAVSLAIDYAHRQGIVHRDVKPDNIMIHDGVAVVTDFGIGKGLSATEEGLTTAGITLGTPTYMSPEQVTADPDCDGRSDIYSLGCVLFEMLTGEPPFTAPTPQAAMAKRVVEPPPRLRTDRGTFPAVIDRVVQRALATAPEGRYATGAEMAQAITTALAMGGGGGGGGGTSEVVAETRKAVAVLPFVNMSSDPENEFLSDGISEDITHVLGKVEGLRVVARTSAFAFKGKTEDVRRIGEALGVSHVVEGSVRKTGSRLRITSRLIDVHDGCEQWSSTYDRSLDDVFKIQDEITAAVVEQLKVKLLGDAARRPSSSTDAFGLYETYLKGRHCWNKRNETGLYKSLEFLNTAVETDAQFGLAWSGLAATHLTLGQYGLVRPDEAMPAAKEAANRALEIDPTMAEALAALACVKSVYDWDHRGAEMDFRNAIDLNPQYSTALHWYAINHLAPTGQYDEALEHLRRAQKLDPLSSVINTTVGLVYFYRRDFTEAANQLHDVIGLDETFGIAHYFLGQVLRHESKHADAIAAGIRARALAGNTAETVSALAQTYAAAGDVTKSRALLRDLLERAKTKYVSPGLIALIHIGLQEHDLAFEWFEKAVEMRTPELLWLQVHPAFDPLREDERFHRLLERVFP